MQPGFFDHDDRLAELEKLGDPLPQIDRVVDWEGFRQIIESTRPKRDPRTGGRPWTDARLMWKLLVVQPLAADGRSADGDPILAVDCLGAGRGETVIVSGDRRVTQALLQSDDTPVEWSVLGIRD